VQTIAAKGLYPQITLGKSLSQPYCRRFVEGIIPDKKGGVKKCNQKLKLAASPCFKVKEGGHNYRRDIYSKWFIFYFKPTVVTYR